MSLGILGASVPDMIKCSRAGCYEPAVWIVEWANPKIHTDGRTKKWLACTEHLEYLRGFLDTRGFNPKIMELR